MKFTAGKIIVLIIVVGIVGVLGFGLYRNLNGSGDGFAINEDGFVDREAEPVEQGLTVSIIGCAGDGQMLMKGSMVIQNNRMVPWAPNMEHVWEFGCTAGGYTFSPDPNDPLRFRVDAKKGYVYVGGKGSVTLPDGKVVQLPPAR